MLNARTRAILSQLTPINNSVIITYPITAVIMGKTIQAFVDLEQQGETALPELGIWSISEMNSIINVIDDGEISIENGIITVKNSTSSIKYATSNLNILEDACKADLALINRIKANEKVFSFRITAKELDSIKKTSSLLKDLTDLEISSSGGKVSLTAKSKEKSTNSYSVQVSGEGEDCSVTLIMENVNKIPNADYECSVYRNPKGVLVSVFVSTSVPGLELFVAHKA